MPRATLSTTAERHELVSVPEGYVELRRMSYGDWLARRDMSMEIAMKGTSRKDATGAMTLQNAKVTLFEFSKCVVGSNLTDEADQPLNFNSPNILEVIDPKVGNEIGQLINGMHDFEDDLGN